ncbi:C45 family autoproteolytic acyltransferase/hydolase [Saccharothrix xinjiangensis]|uniref:C45 family autoproteolytic acyltransferase/hydrolase n=1 Tax=Saccharothrix xinjiangensis TaxID=204798 RepID=A0ABV9XV47_9PSEU
MTGSVGKDGWTYLRLDGEPGKRGDTHGRELGDAIAKSLRRADFMSKLDTGEPFDFFTRAVSETFDDFPGISDEIREELRGIAEGASRATGSTITLQQIIALNAYEELVDSWWPTSQAHGATRRLRGARPRCSAFIATGSHTADGRIVAAHNSWDRFSSGDALSVVLDIRPPAGEGHRVLMQAAPGWVTSNTDWMVTGAGLVVLETTIGSFDGAFAPDGDPEFYRSRRATQHAADIEGWTALFSENNNVGYVNTWMLGGTHRGVENTIALYELGKGGPGDAWFTHTTNGFYTGYNVANSPEIRLQQCTDPMQRFDIRGNAARRVRLEQLLTESEGKVDATRAQEIIGDHFDVYRGEESAGSRSICGHLDLDKGEYGNHGQPPYFPWGANDGKAYHAGSDPEDPLGFRARWGNSCGQEFDPAAFVRDHPQYAEFAGHMDHRTGYPWTAMPPR